MCLSRFFFVFLSRTVEADLLKIKSKKSSSLKKEISPYLGLNLHSSVIRRRSDLMMVGKQLSSVQLSSK
jgi:hypothetical protein